MSAAEANVCRLRVFLQGTALTKMCAKPQRPLGLLNHICWSSHCLVPRMTAVPLLEVNSCFPVHHAVSSWYRSLAC